MNKRRLGPGRVTVLVLLGLIDLFLLIRYFVIGKNITLFNPQGLIAHDQHSLFVLVMILLFAIAIPVVIFLYFVAWKFRESNTKATRTTHAQGGKFLIFSIWAYPTIFFLVFSAILIPATIRLEPRKALAPADETLKIQVIAMRWKWLFLYPDQNIATVNYVKFPKDMPVLFEMTADNAPMSSFWIPNIGGQLYAMTGHNNRLNLSADKVGNYPGYTAEINGSGFADMKFTASVSSPDDFDLWVQDMQRKSKTLDTGTYDNLVKPSEANKTAFYGSYQSNLYNTVMMKYMGSHEMQKTSHEGHE